MILLLGGYGLVRASMVPVRRAAQVARIVPQTSPSPQVEAPGPRSLVGPPAPERPATTGPRAGRGPIGKHAPLPPAWHAGPFAEPALPLAIAPRRPGLAMGTPPLLPDPRDAERAAIARVERSAETSVAKPLTLRLRAVPSENTIQGPGEWLRITASASVPCYVIVFHVSGDHHVRTVFPRRFDLMYEPNISYTFLDRADPGDTGEIVVAVASVYRMTAADALAAIRSGRAVAPTAARGPLATELWDALEANLRAKVSGPGHIRQWEPHAWRVALAMRRAPAAEDAARETQPPQRGSPRSGAGETSAPGGPQSPGPPTGPGPAKPDPPAAPRGGEAPSRRTGGVSPP